MPTYRLMPGHIKEERMREALRSTGAVEVFHTEELDFIYKLDCIARLKDEPLTPSVGIQFTGRHCEVKEKPTIQAMRRGAVVNRFLYLRCQAPLTREAGGMLLALVKLVASAPDSMGIVVATLCLDHGRHYCLTGVEGLPLHDAHTPKGKDLTWE